MNCFKRPYIRAGVALLGAAFTFAPTTWAQTSRIAQIIEEANPLLLHSSSQGYLGVLVGDIDSDSATRLKLKDARGALVTLIDHDAPAAQVGLHVNDVLLEVNGQAVEGAEAFGRMMREIPPGRKITLLVSRDGATQTMTVQLADRKKMENDVWNKLNDNESSSPATGLGILGTGAGGDAPLPGGFHMPFVGNSTLKVGAIVEPLTSQMADYLGVQNGLMVKQVVHKSEAAASGMKPFDVIIKVGSDNIATVSDWERSMRANQGKSVQITILRDKRQQTITLQVDSKHRGAVEFEQLLPDGPDPLLAFAGPDTAFELEQQLAMDAPSVEAMREQAEKLKDQMREWQDQSGNVHLFELSPQMKEELQNQAEQFRDAFKGKSFGIDQKQMDELKQQMKEFSKDFPQLGFNFNPDDWKNWQLQMNNVPSLDEQMREEMKRQMDQLKRQMEEMQELGFDHLA